MINKLMQYPLISEYLAAIRDAHDNLDKLSHLVPVLDNYGEPYRSSGAFAVVFKMKDEQTGKCYALKCFTEEQEGRAEAYRQIAEELEFVASPYITSVKYLEKELFVDSNCKDNEFPVLLMDWIEGETMETYFADHYMDNYAMAMLCYRFCKMAAWLRSQPFAHGDIKPDNIMVRPDGTLTLVDYDGMFVPAMKGQKSPTIGTKDFSHPLRTIDDFDETIDDFALTSMALSLKAISLNPSLLNEYGASDRLLFSAADYLDLSKSKTMTALHGLLADEEIKTLLSMFLLASAQKNLSMCSFRLFGVEKPKEEVWSTVVTEEDLENAVEDEFGVKYSKDWKRLLKAPQSLSGKYSIRKGVKVIGNMAFSSCRSLTNINIPNSVTTIGDSAFWGCDSLTNINIPNSVTMIGNSAFAWCNSLTSINIPNSVTTIGDWGLGACKSLVNINIPNSVTTIGKDAFAYCDSLTSINIPNSVTTIGYWGLRTCKSLTSITIPNSVVTIIGNPFYLWHGNLYNESKAFIYEDHVLFNKNKTILIAYRAKGTNYTIPNSVTTIGEGAFCGCDSLTNINIPNSVTTIGKGAFSHCDSLTSINIPNSVTTIGISAFWGCDSLTNINIPNSVTTIGKCAFSDCKSLTNINIPNSVTTIEDWTFHNCINLPSHIKSEIIQRFGEKVFY
jgi:serine/threonine protein kinase